jgi:hypothetical protein
VRRAEQRWVNLLTVQRGVLLIARSVLQRVALEQPNTHESLRLLVRQNLHVLLCTDVIELYAQERRVNQDRIGLIEFKAHLLELFRLSFQLTI